MMDTQHFNTVEKTRPAFNTVEKTKTCGSLSKLQLDSEVRAKTQTKGGGREKE